MLIIYVSSEQPKVGTLFWGRRPPCLIPYRL